jgi:serine/threonine-protein kinase
VKYWVSSGRAQVDVPSIVGLKIEEAQRRLAAAGLKLGKRTGEFSPEELGTVLSQNPRAGQEVRTGDDVEVTFSQGEEKGIVPDVVGQQEADAASILANAGFRVNRVRETHPTVDKGRVFDQDPAAQSEAAPGSIVNIFVSLGPEEFPMPDVGGETESEARAKLEDLGLKVETDRVFVADSSQYGRVQDQDPPPGTTVRRGDTVTIEIGSST